MVLQFLKKYIRISNAKFTFAICTVICGSCATISTSNSVNKNTYSRKIPVNVKIYEQTNRNNLGPCEPSIAINPKNTNHIVAGSVLNYVHTSNDVGRTWNTKTLHSDYGIWGDPTVINDSEGNFYYFHLSDPEGTNWESSQILDRIVVQKSVDNGSNWNAGTGIGLNAPKQQDKPSALVHPQKNELLFCAWTEFDLYDSSNVNDKSRILFSKSEDGGKNWSDAKKISAHEGNCLDDDLTPEGTTIVANRNNVYLAWAYDAKIWFCKSEDYGNTWGDNQIISDQPNGWKFDINELTRANGFPIIKIDHSKSKHRGDIYLNWSTQISENETSVYIAKSKDGGNSWSAPKTVHRNEKKHHFFNWMDIDPKTGYIYIIYYQEIAPNSEKIQTYLSVSKNGGKSFTSFPISENTFNPSGSNFFGDYNNIAVYNGKIRPIWTEVHHGKVSVWTAIIDE